jgi:hypothetical protein
VYIIASTAGSRVVLGASVAGASVVDDSVVGASDAVEAESPPPQAEIAIVASRAKKTGDERNDMRRVSHGAQLNLKLGELKLDTGRFADHR